MARHLLLLVIGASAWGEVLVIVNEGAELNALDRDGMRDTFLGKRSLISGATQVDLVIQEDEGKHGEFLKRYVNVTPSQFRIYWKKRVFTGEGKAPIARSDDQQVIEYVKAHRYAVGYIDAASPHEGVRVLPVPKD
jgi:hypothetical protein